MSDILDKIRADRERDIATGKVCQKCGAYVFSSGGVPVTCRSCLGLLSDGEVDHGKFVRCPQCRDTFDPWDCWIDGYGGGDVLGKIYNGDLVEVWCPTCEHEFKVRPFMEVTWTSPAKDGQLEEP